MNHLIQPSRAGADGSCWLSPLLAAITFLALIPSSTAAQATPLCADFVDEAADSLRSDGFGAYCWSGVSGGATAQFNAGGILTFASGNPGVSGRAVTIFNIAALPPANTREPQNFSPSEYQIQFNTTGPNCFDGLHADPREMAAGSSISVGIVIRVLVPSLLQPNSKLQSEWFVRFGHFPNDPSCETLHNKWPCDGGAAATLTRLDSATWALTATDDPVCLIEAVKSKGGKTTMTQRGNISLPFAMFLTLQ